MGRRGRFAAGDSKVRQAPGLKELCQPEAMGEKARQALLAAGLYVADDVEVSR